MRLKRSGFSLIEVVVAAAIFVIISVLIFAFFRFGTRSFLQANTRHGLQVEALRVMESLQGELKRTNGSTVRAIRDGARAASEGQRDVVSFATLEDWRDRTDGNNFHLDTGAPLWNQYLVFYATLEEPVGRLVRMRLDPNPPPEAPRAIPMSDLDDLHNNNPTLNTFDGGAPPYIVLSKNVVEFKFTPGLDGAGKETGEFEATLKLKQKSAKSAVESHRLREFDYYEIQVSVRPENSFPNSL